MRRQVRGAEGRGRAMIGSKRAATRMLNFSRENRKKSRCDDLVLRKGEKGMSSAEREIFGHTPVSSPISHEEEAAARAERILKEKRDDGKKVFCKCGMELKRFLVNLSEESILMCPDTKCVLDFFEDREHEQKETTISEQKEKAASNITFCAEIDDDLDLSGLFD
mmetsp:Transcript_16338/g.24610  ORF Transcript_16338/g.24610 Transcript_16338/m.24610 type:complete len:165 (+) Transcript_16338:3-497(+)